MANKANCSRPSLSTARPGRVPDRRLTVWLGLAWLGIFMTLLGGGTHVGLSLDETVGISVV